MYKFWGTEFIPNDWVFRLSGVKFDDVALFVLFLTIGLFCGPAAAAAWIGLALGVRFVIRHAEEQLLDIAPQAPALFLKLKPLGESGVIAAGLAWVATTQASAAAGVAMLAALGLLAMRLSSRPAFKSYSAAASMAGAVLLILAIAFLRGEGALASAILIGGCFGVLGGKLIKTRRKLARAALEAEMLAHALKQARDGVFAVWSLDFRTQKVEGGEQFTTSLGQPLCFDSVTAGLFGAAAEDRELVAAMFAPSAGCTRQLYLTHSARAFDGRCIRLEHHALLHADAFGHPVRLTCMTSIIDIQQGMLSVTDQWTALRAHFAVASKAEEPCPNKDVLVPFSAQRRARA